MSTSPKDALAAEIRGRLASKRISQAAAAKWLNISQSSMSRRLLGESSFTVDEIYRVAALIGVTAADLLAAIPAPDYPADVA